MESLLEMESHMQHGKSLAPILLSHDFVLSLIICSLEVVIVSLKLVCLLSSTIDPSLTALSSSGAFGVSYPSEYPQTKAF